MTYGRHPKHKWPAIAVCILLLLILVGLLLYMRHKSHSMAEQLQEMIETREDNGQSQLDKSAFICTTESAGQITFEGETVIVDAEAFAQAAAYSNYHTVSFSYGEGIEPDKTYLLRLVVRAESECAKMNIAINDGIISATYPVYTDMTEINVPISNIGRLNSVTLTLKTELQKLYVSSIELIDSGCTDVRKLRAGVYLCGATETVFSEADCFGGESRASAVVGEYLYSVCRGQLSVYDISKDTPELISEITGIGEAVDLAAVNNGQGLAVSSRANGVYFVDISDPGKPEIASHYDTLELATGIDGCGAYVFVCSRYFGIEILDSSNLEEPKYILQIAGDGKEYFDCCYDNGLLFVSAWGQQQVDIYDLTDDSGPRKLSELTVDGNPGGIAAKDGLLFVSTGYHSQDNAEEQTSAGFGSGNGLEIYDVSNPSAPVWLSTSKIDGRYRYTGNDFWKVEAAGNYAVFASTYNGAYIYDISDPKSPKRVDQVKICIEKESASYQKYAGGNYCFSWDVEDHGQAAILSLALSKDRVFFGDPDTGLHAYSLEGMTPESQITNADLSIKPVKDDENYRVQGYEVSVFQNESSIYGAVASGDVIYVGTSEGILLLDDSMREISLYPTEGAVKDLEISKDGAYLYAAESEAGVAVYEVDGAQLKETGRHALNEVYNYAASSLHLSADESVLTVQTGFNRVEYLDVREKDNITSSSRTTEGSMYYRNIAANDLLEQYAVSYSGAEYSLALTENGEIDDVISLPNDYSGERDGIAVTEDTVIAITSRGYVYFSPLEIQEDELSSLTVQRIPDITLHGKANVNGNLMVVSDGITGIITLVDVSALNEPKLICQFEAKGNPDIAYMTDHEVLIPLRHGGLIRLRQ